MSEQSQQFIQQATQALNEGAFGQVIQLTDQALATDPNSADAYILRGIALAQTSQPEAATGSFRQAISLDPNNPKAYYNLATHQYQLGQRVEALAMAREAMRVDPRHQGARDLIALIEQETGQTAWAPPPVERPGYAAPPYTQRPGYADQGANSIAFVEKMGSTWVLIGWILAFVAIGTTVYTIFSMADLFQTIFANPNADPDAAVKKWQASQGSLYTLMSIISWLNFALIVGWGALDIANRRGNWLWMIGFICCNIFGLPIYLLAGRK